MVKEGSAVSSLSSEFNAKIGQMCVYISYIHIASKNANAFFIYVLASWAIEQPIYITTVITNLHIMTSLYFHVQSVGNLIAGQVCWC